MSEASGEPSDWIKKLRESYPQADSNELLSSKPMMFGNEFDFHTAVAELKWLKQKQGRLFDDDLKQVSSKYQIPKGMLADGLEGRLTFPRDFMISTSPWFPVLYAWAVGDETAQNDLFLKRVRHQHSGFNYILAAFLIPLVVGGIANVLWNTLQSLGYGLGDILKTEAFLLAAIPFYVALLINLHHRVEDNWRQLRDQMARMFGEGRGSIVQSVMKFVQSKLASQFLSASFFLRKNDEEILEWYQSKQHFYAYYLASVEMTDLQPIRAMDRPSIWGFLSQKRGRMAPETSEKKTTHTVPMFMTEDPHKAYRERMKAILTKSKSPES